MNVLTIVVLLLTKHFIADFPLQNQYMLGKAKSEGWQLPLFAHCAVHMILTLAVLGFVCPRLWWLAIVEGAAHFVIDRIKAAPTLGGRWNISQWQFWSALGLDQYAHQMCYVAMAAYVQAHTSGV
jgi:hypothetical protein